jgi:hypothetical protein
MAHANACVPGHVTWDAFSPSFIIRTGINPIPHGAPLLPVTRDLGDISLGAPSWSLFAVFALECGLAWLFSSLTVEVSGAEFRWYFGPGLWDYRVALSDIADVRTVRNAWLNGFAIRAGPGWRLYNVSGLDAVELRLKSGDISHRYR